MTNTAYMKKRIFPAMLIACITLLSVACSKDKDIVTGTESHIGTDTVYMRGSVYTPASLTVMPGIKVTWINDDNVTHTVTADDGSFNSGDIVAGSKFSFTFTTLGTYNYHCGRHAGMTGTVFVATR